MLESFYKNNVIEAGCDEAGRGCLAGPVYAAAVILPNDYKNKFLDDSKKYQRKNVTNFAKLSFKMLFRGR